MPDPTPSDITPAELRRRVARVKRSWDRKTREKRRVEKKFTRRPRWTPPEIELDPEIADIFNVRTLDFS